MCMIEFVDDGVPGLACERHVGRARKPYRCEECGRTISAGEAYRRTFLVWEGGAVATKTCRHCAVGQDWLNANCGGYVVGHVAQDIAEHIGEYPALSAPLGHLLDGMKTGWDGGQAPLPESPPEVEP